MTRYYPPNRKRHLSTPGLKLLKFLMDRGGSATLWEIGRRSADGRLLAQARPELDGLIIEQKCGSPRTGRSVTRVFLTMKGWAACATLRPGWTPRRLATEVLKAWLLELQNERDPWACQFSKDADDAAELKRLRAIGWIRPPLKKPGPPKGTFNAGSFRPKSALAPNLAGRVPDRRDIVPPPVGARVFPRIAPSGVKCRECGLDTAAHRIGCSSFGQPSVPVFGSKSTPMTVPQTPVQQLSPEEARKAELKKFCILCKDGIGGEHDCSRFQLT